MTYHEQVKAEVAARYGIPVLCEVQIIPQGVSGIIDESYSWAILRRAKLKNHVRAQRLRAAEANISSPRRPRAGSKARAESKARMAARREQHRAMIEPLIDRGLTMRQMAEESGMSLSTVHRWVTRIKVEAMQAA